MNKVRIKLIRIFCFIYFLCLASASQENETIGLETSSCVCTPDSCPCTEGVIIWDKNVYEEILLPESGSVVTITSDFLNLTQGCFIWINNHWYKEDDSTGAISLTLDAPVTIASNGSECSWTIWYTVYNKTVLENETGVIQPILSNGSYIPNQGQLWVMKSDLEDPLHVEMNITLLDLSESRYDNSLQDYIMIGQGENIPLGSEDEYMYFGNQTELETIRINSSTAHVYFFSGPDSPKGSGFYINYWTVVEPSETTERTSKKAPAVPPTELIALAAINGINKTGGESSEYKLKFQNAMAEIANNYLEAKNITFDYIVPSNICIVEVKTCLESFCQKNCMAYSFYIDVKDQNGNYTFTKEDLHLMLFLDLELTNDLLHQNIDQNCEICNEQSEAKWTFTMGVLMGVLAFVLTVTLVVVIVTRSKGKHIPFPVQTRRFSTQSEGSEFYLPWESEPKVDVTDFSEFGLVDKGYLPIYEPFEIEGPAAYRNHGLCNDDDYEEIYRRVPAKKMKESLTTTEMKPIEKIQQCTSQGSTKEDIQKASCKD